MREDAVVGHMARSHGCPKRFGSSRWKAPRATGGGRKKAPDPFCVSGATQQDIYTGITSATPSTSCTSCRHDQVLLDSQGRQSTNGLESDPQGATTVATTYDSVGRVYTTSNPYRSTGDQTYGLNTLAYDGLSRVTSVTHQDSNVAHTYYGSNVSTNGGAGSQLCASVGVGYPTLTVDENGRKSQTWADAPGRTIETDEPDSNNSMTLGTCYTYDALDDLTQIVQGGQTRSYTYDGWPRKTAETTPEAGAVNYYYTTSGGTACSGNPPSVCRRSDARSITTTYSYDALNRLTSKTYSDTTPSASFYYDESSVSLNGTQYTLGNAKGRMSHTSAAGGNAITIHSFDAMGRRTDLWQCTPYNCSSSSIWDARRTYDLAGDLTSFTFASGATISYTVSNAQRVTQVSSSSSDSTHPATLAQSITYAAHGGITGLLDGCAGSGCVQRQETYDYNNRLEPVRIQLGTSGTPNANSCLVYNLYAGVGNPSSCAIPSQGSSGNDGTVMGHLFQDTTNSSLGHTATLTYDNLNRLATSVATGSATHNLTFSYDRYGNMTCVTNGQTNGPCPNYSFSSSTNRMTNTNYTYDSSGNLLQNGTGLGSHTYQWDAENRMVSVDGVAGQACQSSWTACYVYNALDQRVEKNVGGTYAEVEFNASGEEVEFHNRTVWVQSFVPFGGRHLAHYQNSVTYFPHIDALGTTGQLTDNMGAVAQDELHYPWGQQWSMVGGMQEERFASLKHRDTETTLDPTHFRLFSSTQGRWFSADPKRGCVRHPQQFNRYAYVSNTPTTLIDPRGDIPCDSFEDPLCSGSGITFCNECRSILFFEENNLIQCCSECGVCWGGVPLPPVTGGGGGTCHGTISHSAPDNALYRCVGTPYPFVQEFWQCDAGGDKECCAIKQANFNSCCKNYGWQPYPFSNNLGLYYTACCAKTPWGLPPPGGKPKWCSGNGIE